MITREQDGANQYYLFNAYGNVTQRADAWGNLLKNYNYDAFGIETDPEPLDSNPIRYCGEYYDRETGELYLRARYYNPVIGRFVSEDGVRSTFYKLPNKQKATDPLSLNLYTYCRNSPIQFKDPSGNTPSESKIIEHFTRQYYKKYSDYIDYSYHDFKKRVNKFFGEIKESVPNEFNQIIQKLGKTGTAFLDSLSFTAGAGMGIGVSRDTGAFGASAVAKLDIIGFRIANGKMEPLAAQEASLGFSVLTDEQKAQASLEKHDIFLIGDFVSWSTDDAWVDTSGISNNITIGLSEYLGFGGGFSSDFDTRNFLKEIIKIWN